MHKVPELPFQRDNPGEHRKVPFLTLSSIIWRQTIDII